MHDCAILLKIVTESSEKLQYKRPNCHAISDIIWMLLEACWNTNPNNRPSAACVGLVLDLIVGLRTTNTLNVEYISALMDRMLDDTSSGQAFGYRHSRNEARGKQVPYPCKWPACRDSFDSIDNCIRHECAEFLRWRATNLSLGLRL